MIDKFNHWNKYSPEETRELWGNSLITFDTNVLLGLYRTSPQLSNLFFELTENIKERIFISNQVAFEYHKNKFNVITDNYSQLSKLLKEIDKFDTETKNSRLYNYLSKETKTAIEQDIRTKKEKILERETYYKKLEKEDTIYSKLNKLFQNKIEVAPSKEEIETLLKEGKNRYTNKVPPGYEDSEKENGNKYGDFFIWKEILKKAEKESKNIIFVTNEKKEDWLWILKDKKIIGARPELKEEFFTKTGKKFQISNFQNYIFNISNLTASNINIESTKKEFKFESIFEDNFLKIVPPQIKATEQNSELLSLQEESINIQKMIEEIISKPEIDTNQKQLLEDLRFRKKIIDEQLYKSFSVNNK